MPFIPAPGDMSWKTHIFPKFVGGLSSAPKSDAECWALDNFEIHQDGMARCRSGLEAFHTSGLLGTDHTVGITFDGNKSIVVAKAGHGTTPGNLYALDISAYPTIAEISVPMPGVCTYPVWFAFINIASTYYVYLGGLDSASLYSWDYLASSLTTVATFSAPIQHLCWHNGYLFVLLSNGELHWSDASDPTTWPGTQYVALALNHGLPLALKSLQDRLVIFCSDGILYMAGDPNQQPYYGLLISDIPFDSPQALTVDGSTSIFHSYESVVQMSGGMSILSNAIPGLPLNSYTGSTAPPWLAASPELIAMRGLDPDGATVLYLYERIRYGTWSRWRYEPGSVLGSTPLGQLAVAYGPVPGRQGFLLPASDGNIYFQPVQNYAAMQANPLWASPNQDLTTTDIIGKLQTRFSAVIEDRLVLKELRQFQIMGYGTDITVTFEFVLPDGSVSTVPIVLRSDILPLQQSVPMQPPWIEARMTITGSDLTIRDVMWVWRALRYGLLQVGTAGSFPAPAPNINCVNCVNCDGCVNCTNCSNCTNCTNSTGCNNCTNCPGCTDCTGCENCTGCTNCNNCTSCGNKTGLSGANGLRGGGGWPMLHGDGTRKNASSDGMGPTQFVFDPSLVLNHEFHLLQFDDLTHVLLDGGSYGYQLDNLKYDAATPPNLIPNITVGMSSGASLNAWAVANGVWYGCGSNGANLQVDAVSLVGGLLAWSYAEAARGTNPQLLIDEAHGVIYVVEQGNPNATPPTTGFRVIALSTSPATPSGQRMWTQDVGAGQTPYNTLPMLDATAQQMALPGFVDNGPTTIKTFSDPTSRHGVQLQTYQEEQYDTHAVAINTSSQAIVDSVLTGIQVNGSMMLQSGKLCAIQTESHWGDVGFTPPDGWGSFVGPGSPEIYWEIDLTISQTNIMLKLLITDLLSGSTIPIVLETETLQNIDYTYNPQTRLVQDTLVYPPQSSVWDASEGGIKGVPSVYVSRDVFNNLNYEYIVPNIVYDGSALGTIALGQTWSILGGDNNGGVYLVRQGAGPRQIQVGTVGYMTTAFASLVPCASVPGLPCTIRVYTSTGGGPIEVQLANPTDTQYYQIDGMSGTANGAVFLRSLWDQPALGVASYGSGPPAAGARNIDVYFDVDAKNLYLGTNIVEGNLRPWMTTRITMEDGPPYPRVTMPPDATVYIGPTTGAGSPVGSFGDVYIDRTNGAVYWFGENPKMINPYGWQGWSISTPPALISRDMGVMDAGGTITWTTIPSTIPGYGEPPHQTPEQTGIQLASMVGMDLVTVGGASYVPCTDGQWRRVI